MGDQIPLLGRILCLAQTVDVFFCAYGLEAVTTMLMSRRGRWFDPNLVFVLAGCLGDTGFWEEMRNECPATLTLRHEPPDRVFEATEGRLNAVTRAFARVIDAKSPYTKRHSDHVAARAGQLGRALELPPRQLTILERAAMLHDIGMLGVSSRILEKPAPLTTEEWDAVRRHPVHTREILSRVAAFDEVAPVAAAHHENLDGSGYPDGLVARQISLPARILAVASRAEALLEDRPWRRARAYPEMLRELQPLAGRIIDERVYGALAALSPSR